MSGAALLREQLARFAPGLRPIADDVLAAASRIDVVAIDERGGTVAAFAAEAASRQDELTARLAQETEAAESRIEAARSEAPRTSLSIAALPTFRHGDSVSRACVCVYIRARTARDMRRRGGPPWSERPPSSAIEWWAALRAYVDHGTARMMSR